MSSVAPSDEATQRSPSPSDGSPRRSPSPSDRSPRRSPPPSDGSPRRSPSPSDGSPRRSPSPLDDSPRRSSSPLNEYPSRTPSPLSPLEDEVYNEEDEYPVDHYNSDGLRGGEPSASDNGNGSQDSREQGGSAESGISDAIEDEDQLDAKSNSCSERSAPAEGEEVDAFDEADADADLADGTEPVHDDHVPSKEDHVLSDDRNLAGEDEESREEETAGRSVSPDRGDVADLDPPASPAGSGSPSPSPSATRSPEPDPGASSAPSAAPTPTPPPGDEALARDLASGRPKRNRRRPQRWEAAALEPATSRSNRRSATSAGVATSGANSAATGGSGSAGGGSRNGPLRDAVPDDRPSVLGLLAQRGDKRAGRGSSAGGGGGFLSGGGGWGVADSIGGGSSANFAGASTASVRSIESSSPPPEPVDPLAIVQSGIDLVRKGATTKRGVVEAFHLRQLRAISSEANYQKLLHAYLRRRLRKRTNRALERERVEEDALRNACSAPPAAEEREHGEVGRKSGTKRGIDELYGVAPEKVRLPLEAYFPRRIRKADECTSIQELVEDLPEMPDHAEGIAVWQAPTPSWAALAVSVDGEGSGKGQAMSKVDCLRLNAPVSNKPSGELLSD